MTQNKGLKGINLGGEAGQFKRGNRIVSGERLTIDLGPLRHMHRALISGELLTLDQVEAARRVTDQCHAAYCALPREVILSHSRTEQIAVELESLGISPSA